MKSIFQRTTQSDIQPLSQTDWQSTADATNTKLETAGAGIRVMLVPKITYTLVPVAVADVEKFNQLTDEEKLKFKEATQTSTALIAVDSITENKG